jgi:hypothetical protein
MAVCGYFKTCDDVAQIYVDWFTEAAIRDMIYDLTSIHNNEKINKLKKLLDKNDWIQETIIK